MNSSINVPKKNSISTFKICSFVLNSGMNIKFPMHSALAQFTCIDCTFESNIKLLIPHIFFYFLSCFQFACSFFSLIFCRQQIGSFCRLDFFPIRKKNTIISHLCDLVLLQIILWTFLIWLIDYLFLFILLGKDDVGNLQFIISQQIASKCPPHQQRQ